MSVSSDCERCGSLPGESVSGPSFARALLERTSMSGQLAPSGQELTACSAANGSSLDEVLGQVVEAVRQAAFAGEIEACLRKDGQCRALPPAAFENPKVVSIALWEGRFELHPLWPDEWQDWNGSDWALDGACLDATAAHVGKLPTVRPFRAMPADLARNPMRLLQRVPRDRTMVPLAEAVTWIAFGLALEARRLERAIAWGALCRGNLKEAQQRIDEGAKTLIEAGARDTIAFQGRHIVDGSTDGVLTERITSLRLADFAQFVVEGANELHYGSGCHRWHPNPAWTSSRHTARTDYFADVTVERSGLMKLFPQRSQPAANRQLDREALIASAKELRRLRPGISRGSVALSLAAELPVNPTTGKPRDTRHIERIIGCLWEGESS
jgi:hypothetical protein